MTKNDDFGYTSKHITLFTFKEEKYEKLQKTLTVMLTIAMMAVYSRLLQALKQQEIAPVVRSNGHSLMTAFLP
ncbi:MAG: hypothetical protein E7671_06450 [Ruminococcaceae bacterium]|nr:hypothetical protein [Oscillospiraceae bacterium]